MIDIEFHCDEKGNFQKGFPVRAFSYKDYSIERHNHDFYEVNIVMSGVGTHCIENSEFRVKSGDVFVIPPMVVHAYTDVDKLEVYHILLKKSFIDENRTEAEKIKGFLQLIEIEPFLRSNFLNAFFLHLSQLQLVQLKNELAFIDDNSAFSWEECSLMKYHTTWKIIYWFAILLNRQFDSNHCPIKHKYEIPIIAVLEYIHTNYGEKITIETQTLDGQKKTVTQNVWATSDNKLWYWEGRQNKYIEINTKGGGGRSR